jgi:hypothetical protein
MTLSEYLDREDAPSLTDLSAKLGISKGRLSQLRSESDWPADLALKVEKETGGLLNASALSSIVARARQDAA